MLDLIEQGCTTHLMHLKWSVTGVLDLVLSLILETFSGSEMFLMNSEIIFHGLSTHCPQTAIHLAIKGVNHQYADQTVFR